MFRMLLWGWRYFKIKQDNIRNENSLEGLKDKGNIPENIFSRKRKCLTNVEHRREKMIRGSIQKV